MANASILCPHCGRLIDRRDPSCPWCGAQRPRLWNRLTGWISKEPHGESLIKAIIGANVCIYIVSLLLSKHSALGGNPLTFLSPDQRSLLLMGATGAVPVLEMGRFWTLISASYLHGGLLHIFFNMIALRQIGPWVSAEFGSNRMFVIYTGAGICGYLASCLAGIPFTIGASASVCGLIGALFYFGKSRGGSYGSAVSREVSGWMISLVLFGLVMPGINNWGHGGGLVGGIAMGKLLGYRERGPERCWHRLLAVGCVLATILVLLWSVFVAYVLWPSSSGGFHT